MNGLVKSAAHEVGTLGITVNAILPGLTETDTLREKAPQTAQALGMSYEALIEMFTQASAIKRPNTVDEVAAVALLLASDAGRQHDRHAVPRRRRDDALLAP